MSDTPEHAELSARLNKVNLSRYQSLPVGTDEKLFRPKKSTPVEPFRVFYYTTNMQPLHGIDYVLEAAERLAGERRIRFLLVGGKKPMETAVNRVKKRGARIDYMPWIAFDDLPDTMRSSGVNLGGPFGGTNQAQHVVTGKTYQSIACAVPTVIGANPSTERYFEDKKNCLLVQQQSADAIVNALTWAVDHPKELEKIGQAGRQLFEKRFSADALSERLKKLVDAL